MLELVVALTIFALISVAVFGALRIGITCWNKSEERAGEQLRFRTVCDLIERQVSCLSAVTIPLDSGLIRGQKIPFFRGTADRLEFVSLSALKFQESPGLTLVTYFLKEDRGRRYLAENERRYLGPDSLDQVMIGPDTDIHLFEIENAEFRYYERLEDGSGNWTDSWDSALRWLLPEAIEIRVLFKRNSSTLPQAKRFVIPVVVRPFNQTNPRQWRSTSPNQINRPQRPQGGVRGQVPGPVR